MRLVAALVALALIGAVAFWALTAPAELDAGVAKAFAQPGDAKAGETVFWAAGCSSCHAKSAEPLKLGGGLALATPFGQITPPNISPDREDGIGAWSGVLVELWCPLVNLPHALVGHALPLAVVIAIGALWGRRALDIAPARA